MPTGPGSLEVGPGIRRQPAEAQRLALTPSSGWNSVSSPVTPTPCSFEISQSCLGIAALTLNPRGRGGFLDLGQDVWTTMVLHRRSNAIKDTVHLAQCWQGTLHAQQGLLLVLSLPICPFLGATSPRCVPLVP